MRYMIDLEGNLGPFFTYKSSRLFSTVASVKGSTPDWVGLLSDLAAASHTQHVLGYPRNLGSKGIQV
jgi:hypothetical protein